jgi:hypothetical protein
MVIPKTDELDNRTLKTEAAARRPLVRIPVPLESYPLPRANPVRARDRGKTWFPVRLEDINPDVRARPEKC